MRVVVNFVTEFQVSQDGRRDMIQVFDVLSSFREQDPYLKKDAEGEGEGDHHQQPGDAEQQPAEESQTRVTLPLQV